MTIYKHLPRDVLNTMRQETWDRRITPEQWMDENLCGGHYLRAEKLGDMEKYTYLTAEELRLSSVKP